MSKSWSCHRRTFVVFYEQNTQVVIFNVSDPSRKKFHIKELSVSLMQTIIPELRLLPVETNQQIENARTLYRISILFGIANFMIAEALTSGECANYKVEFDFKLRLQSELRSLIDRLGETIFPFPVLGLFEEAYKDMNLYEPAGMCHLWRNSKDYLNGRTNAGLGPLTQNAYQGYPQAVMPNPTNTLNLPTAEDVNARFMVYRRATDSVRSAGNTPSPLIETPFSMHPSSSSSGSPLSRCPSTAPSSGAQSATTVTSLYENIVSNLTNSVNEEFAKQQRLLEKQKKRQQPKQQHEKDDVVFMCESLTINLDEEDNKIAVRVKVPAPVKVKGEVIDLSDDDEDDCCVVIPKSKPKPIVLDDSDEDDVNNVISSKSVKKVKRSKKSKQFINPFNMIAKSEPMDIVGNNTNTVTSTNFNTNTMTNTNTSIVKTEPQLVSVPVNNVPTPFVVKVEPKVEPKIESSYKVKVEPMITDGVKVELKVPKMEKIKVESSTSTSTIKPTLKISTVEEEDEPMPVPFVVKTEVQSEGKTVAETCDDEYEDMEDDESETPKKRQFTEREEILLAQLNQAHNWAKSKKYGLRLTQLNDRIKIAGDGYDMGLLSKLKAKRSILTSKIMKLDLDIDKSLLREKVTIELPEPLMYLKDKVEAFINKGVSRQMPTVQFLENELKLSEGVIREVMVRSMEAMQKFSQEEDIRLRERCGGAL